MVGRELVSGVVVDEAMVQKPFDGAALSANVTQACQEEMSSGGCS